MDEDSPKTLLEFEDRFRTEGACWTYLVQARWPDGFRCPRCGGSHAWLLQRRVFQCRGCDAMVSATAGTIFHHSHLPPAGVVSGDLVAHQPEERRERRGAAAYPRPGEL